MLSGIKTGKKKRKRPAPGASAPPAAAASSHSTAVAAAPPTQNNRSAADALRASLLGGGGCGGGVATQHDECNHSNAQAKLDARVSAYKSNESTIQSFEKRGRISQETLSTNRDDDNDNNDTIVINTKIPTNKDIHQHEKEHGVRFNSRGKLSRHAHTTLRQKTEEEMTIQQMVAQERNTPSSSSGGGMDEIYAKNIHKMGKNFKALEKIMGTNSKSGADEEDYGQETSQLVSSLYSNNDDKYSPAQLAMKQKSQEIAQHDALAKWKSKSWWWLESPSFNKQYLIALGDRVSLVMCPTHLALNQEPSSSSSSWTGGQCFIVPLPHCESFVGLDEEVWQEVHRFQQSLRNMFRREGREVLFLETVTRTSRGGGGGGGLGLQAKMEVIPVPRRVERDAPLFFKSALSEVAQEWGTHGQKPIVLNDKKTLRNAVPKGFPYFYIGWEGGGFVQMIENEDDGDDDDDNGGSVGMRASGGSKSFGRDFGIDTIAGMMELDPPVRFQRRQRSSDGDRSAILKFCDKWKPFDWTLELDG
mmetsp:Transcript_30551/g.61295  ORF Transcript_30551/g.61295 Transcript_30551/m.61295 type:complete len:531 (+) Transcript_30551:100-1692(+)